MQIRYLIFTLLCIPVVIFAKLPPEQYAAINKLISEGNNEDAVRLVDTFLSIEIYADDPTLLKMQKILKEHQSKPMTVPKTLDNTKVTFPINATNLRDALIELGMHITNVKEKSLIELERIVRDLPNGFVFDWSILKKLARGGHEFAAMRYAFLIDNYLNDIPDLQNINESLYRESTNYKEISNLYDAFKTLPEAKIEKQRILFQSGGNLPKLPTGYDELLLWSQRWYLEDIKVNSTIGEIYARWQNEKVPLGSLDKFFSNGDLEKVEQFLAATRQFRYSEGFPGWRTAEFEENFELYNSKLREARLKLDEVAFNNLLEEDRFVAAKVLEALEGEWVGFGGAYDLKDRRGSLHEAQADMKLDIKRLDESENKWRVELTASSESKERWFKNSFNRSNGWSEDRYSIFVSANNWVADFDWPREKFQIDEKNWRSEQNTLILRPGELASSRGEVSRHSPYSSERRPREPVRTKTAIETFQFSLNKRELIVSGDGFSFTFYLSLNGKRLHILGSTSNKIGDWSKHNINFETDRGKRQFEAMPRRMFMLFPDNDGYKSLGSLTFLEKQ